MIGQETNRSPGRTGKEFLVGHGLLRSEKAFYTIERPDNDRRKATLPPRHRCGTADDGLGLVGVQFNDLLHDFSPSCGMTLVSADAGVLNSRR